MSDDLNELELIQYDKLSDLVFLIGTYIGIYANLKAEQDIISQKEKKTCQSQAASETTIDDLVLIVILLFLIGTILIAFTAVTRLKKQLATICENLNPSALNNIKGSVINIIGLILRITGYVFSATGNRIRAANPI